MHLVHSSLSLLLNKPWCPVKGMIHFTVYIFTPIKKITIDMFLTQLTIDNLLVNLSSLMILCCVQVIKIFLVTLPLVHLPCIHITLHHKP